MRITAFAPLVAAALAALGTAVRPATAADTRISEPFVHDNLAVYFVHGDSVAGPVPLSLQEGLAKGTVRVIETGSVNELQIENTGGEAVFVQAGDIVKGGKQDRVLTVSFLLPASSGRVPISSFCVEQGRWSARGGEDQRAFGSAQEAMPSKSALLALAAPEAQAGASAPANPAAQSAAETAWKQHRVWDEVAKTQRKLADSLNAAVAAPQSATSLQLTLENANLAKARADFVSALEAQGLNDGEIVGFVTAINGTISSANVYPSNALFRKMWRKQLAAAITEAIGDKSANPVAAPPAAIAKEFLSNAEAGKAQERASAAGARLETREAANAVYNEAKGADGNWVHKSYLAK
jgi:hypothetical protein